MDIKKGETWYVSFPEKTYLIDVDILEVTSKTVLIKRWGFCQEGMRYERGEIKFIEKKE